MTTRPRVGARIRLVACTDQYTLLKRGEEGTVSYVDSLGTVFVDWDNGACLGLIPGVDVWELIE